MILFSSSLEYILQNVNIRILGEWVWQTHGYKYVRDLTTVFRPGILVSFLASLIVAPCSVKNHRREKGCIEPGKRTVESGDEAPSQSLQQGQNAFAGGKDILAWLTKKRSHV